MTKAAALHQFFSSFGIPAYTATSVPDDVTFPYLTYELITSAWGGELVGLTVNLWFYTTGSDWSHRKPGLLFARQIRRAKRPGRLQQD